MEPSPALVGYCRAGFESEAGADLRRIAAASGASLELASTAQSGYVVGRLDRRGKVDAALATAAPIFTRSVFVAHGPIVIADAERLAAARGASRVDRVTPLLAAIDTSATAPWQSVWVEFPDTNDGKALSSLARALAPRIEGALRERDALAVAASRRLHLFLPDGATAWVGEGPALPGAAPMGIARLRRPGGAPSRSTLKLAEALAVFLGDREATLMRPGMHAVDLGAAPGGWTWQLAQRGVRVTAVDNGPLKGPVASDPLVTHVRDDAFHFRSRRPVDWLVCDVVETPMRIADLVAQWIAQGRARRAIFNLKLPMKKRYDEVQRCMRRIEDVMQAAGIATTLTVRQLYHDREEVTGYLARVE